MCLAWITVSLWVFIWFPIRPWVFVWFSHFPMVFRGFSHGFQRDSYDFPMLTKIAPGSIHCTEIQPARDTQRLWPMYHTFGGAPDPQFGFSVQLVNIAPSSLWFSGFCGLEKIFPYIGKLIIPIDFHIFQRGWIHQPVFVGDFCRTSYYGL